MPWDETPAEGSEEGASGSENRKPPDNPLLSARTPIRAC